MKITTFNPQIITNHLEEVVGLFEALGFEKRHTKEGIEIAGRSDTVIRMKDENGFSLDVLQSNGETSRDVVGIRINVDDFDEAYRTLLNHGFRNAYGGETVRTASSKAAMMVSPSGLCVSVIQHLK